MRILFAISTLALVALLWAAVSIAQHVRRARRRRRRREFASTTQNVKPTVALNFTEPGVSSEDLVSRVNSSEVTASPALTVATNTTGIGDHASARSDTSAVADAKPPHVDTSNVATADVHSREAEAAGLSGLPVRTPAGRLEVSPKAEEVSLRAFSRTSDEPEKSAIRAAPVPAQAIVAEEQLPAPSVKPSLPGFPKPVRSVSAAQPLSRLAQKMERPDWAYFNKDMGDLTDPYEAPRSKAKDRAGH